MAKAYQKEEISYRTFRKWTATLGLIAQKAAERMKDREDNAPFCIHDTAESRLIMRRQSLSPMERLRRAPSLHAGATPRLQILPSANNH